MGILWAHTGATRLMLCMYVQYLLSKRPSLCKAPTPHLLNLWFACICYMYKWLLRANENILHGVVTSR